MNGTGPIYSISAVAKMLGVPVATLRTWEDRYALVIPERTASRHRLFTREQVEQLRFVKARLDEGASAADAHRLLRERSEVGEVSEQPAPAGTGRTRVLLAENDPFAAEFQEYFLKAEGFETAAAFDYDTAVTALNKLLPSLVVVELLISGGLGLDLCGYLKDRKEAPKILAVSSLDSAEQALAAGADAFLPKPLDPVKYMTTVNELLGSGSAWAGQSAAM
ncbi:MAG TPA: MerR family transcriptional regulator [Actinomycetota bacterium]|jgi:DNA-binding transcriptional MerR regulator|nr:MerR family transcriptional regulator [Actinomycetota bacterium]